MRLTEVRSHHELRRNRFVSASVDQHGPTFRRGDKGRTGDRSDAHAFEPGPEDLVHLVVEGIDEAIQKACQEFRQMVFVVDVTHEVPPQDDLVKLPTFA